MTSSTPRRVVIDDSDPQIRYTGEGWFQDNGSQDGVGNFGPAYNHTLHGTKSDGTLTYTFQGTSVTVLGTTTLAKTAAGIFDPFWECFIDNVSIGATKPFEFPENNWVLCDDQDLVDGLHEITVQINSAGQPFWFDNIRYTPSPSLSLESAVLMVQNQDPGIVFDPQWWPLGGEANMTQVPGSTATFHFTGTSVSWVGFIPHELAHDSSSAAYSIDGGPLISFHLSGLSPSQVVTIYNQIFFTTPKLSPDPHFLVVTYRGTERQTPLTLDYLYVTNTSESTPTTPSIDPTPSSTSSNQVPGSLSTGALVGIVVPCGVILAVVALSLWWYKRGRQRHSPQLEAHQVEVSKPPPPSIYDPSILHVVPPENQTYSTDWLPHHTASVSFTSLSGYDPDTIAQTRAMRKYHEGRLQPLPRLILHQDSGLRLAEDKV